MIPFESQMLSFLKLYVWVFCFVLFCSKFLLWLGKLQLTSRKLADRPTAFQQHNLSGSDNNHSFNGTLFLIKYFKANKLKGVGN